MNHGARRLAAMMRATAILGVLLAGEAMAQARPASPLAAVTIEGEATLKLCRDWLFRHECREYGHIEVPPRVAVGDSFEVTFGSNPKTMWFRVRSVLPGTVDGECLLVPEHEDGPVKGKTDADMDMLIVRGCAAAR